MERERKKERIREKESGRERKRERRKRKIIIWNNIFFDRMDDLISSEATL